MVTQTSNISGAGTDATVSVQIWGPKGMLGGSEIPLDNSKNNFERGEVDTFLLDFPKERDCGYPLEKVWGGRAEGHSEGQPDGNRCHSNHRLTAFISFPPYHSQLPKTAFQLVVELQDSMTLGADWHLDWIEVSDVLRGHTYKWRCGRWFNDKEGKKKEWSAAAVMQGHPLQLELVEAPPGGRRWELPLPG